MIIEFERVILAPRLEVSIINAELSFKPPILDYVFEHKKLELVISNVKGIS